MKFDEDNAVKFIRETLPADVNEKYDDDEILFIIDTIWDYYENNGFLKIDSGMTDEEELDPEKLTAYVQKQIKKDKELMMDPQDVDLIVKGELQYEESLESFI